MGPRFKLVPFVEGLANGSLKAGDWKPNNPGSLQFEIRSRHSSQNRGMPDKGRLFTSMGLKVVNKHSQPSLRNAGVE
ncbi:hypothetical protein CEXT_66271 [Caerostris extrusa]|uniref:Uncharacterized protein n=1 Tax=Caerostris extrusa TaxID=172846 RepID=A0AAV4RSA0_CAEEX|nr:hypothetical protein CEXT_66271 [Caerostris extrusa]